MTVVVTHTTPADGTFSATGAAAWNADHALSGVGTLAEQDANAVAITGGTINGATVGATTASTGRFSDLTDTGLTSGRVTYAGTGGNLVDSANLTFNGTSLTAAGINNTPIGGTTPAAGTFTTLTGNSTSQFGRSSANYFQAAGAAAGFGPVLSAQGSDTNIPAVIQPKGTGALQAQQTDSTATGGNARGANAVDWQTARGVAGQVASGTYSIIGGGFGNNATGFASLINGGFDNNTVGSFSGAASGRANATSANAVYSFVGGGRTNTSSGAYNFIGGGFTNSGTANAAVTTQSATMDGTTAVTLSGSNASIRVGQYITGTSIADDTYVAAISGTSLTLSKVASGSSTSTLSFFTPHGVVVGGGNNQATGSYSFIGGGGDAGTAANRNVASGDWSTVAGGWANRATGIGATVSGGGTFGGAAAGCLASGTSAFVSSGWSNTASGNASSVVGGASNQSAGTFSTVLGGVLGLGRLITGHTVMPASDNPFGSFTLGGSQAGLLVLAKQTTDATPIVLSSTNNPAGTGNQVILPNNSAYFFRGEVVAGVTGGGNTRGWVIEGVIKRGANAASTTLVGTPTVTSSFADAGASTWVIAVTADTTNGGLAVTFTGQAGTTIRVVAKIETTEMTF